MTHYQGYDIYTIFCSADHDSYNIFFHSEGVRLRLSIATMRTSQCEYFSGKDESFTKHSKNVDRK